MKILYKLIKDQASKNRIPSPAHKVPMEGVEMPKPVQVEPVGDRMGELRIGVNNGN